MQPDTRPGVTALQIPVIFTKPCFSAGKNISFGTVSGVN
jgi:hypothetical protein